MHLFLKDTTIRNASKGENLTENHTTHMVSEICTKQSLNEENSSLFMHSVPRALEKEDLTARELLHRADSAGPVSPTCFDV